MVPVPKFEDISRTTHVHRPISPVPDFQKINTETDDGSLEMAGGIAALSMLTALYSAEQTRIRSKTSSGDFPGSNTRLDHDSFTVNRLHDHT
jgi:hypothetical protein